ncbi:MAG: DNA polymerase III subunit beta [Pelagibacteraceae bacterium]|nr:DNA polymerase III subunit beta [Pelagibacteraceae bacterium]|tara:strand:+ start:407 stop:1516 length:1110 start_codon:yes stop_codon:yes gene_type:complete
MEFKLSREALLRVLNHVSSIVDSRSTITILSNLYIKCENNNVEVRSTDMDISIREFVSCESVKNGEATVNSRILTDIIRKTKKNTIIKFKSDGTRLIINSENSVFELNALSADEFPKFVPLNQANSFELTVDQIKRIFNKTKFAISAEETRYYLNGVYFHTVKSDDKNILKTVSTDGHRLAKNELEISSSVDIQGIIMPRKFILQLDKILGDFEGTVKIVSSETQVSFETDSFIIISKLIDGKFPDYEKVIPVENDKLLEIETDPFFNAVDRVSTVNQDKTPTVKLVFENNCVKIMATSTESNKGDEEVQANYTSQKLEILFNSKYLLDLRDVLESENIILELLNQSSPVIVKDPKDNTSIYILMPMRV